MRLRGSTSLDLIVLPSPFIPSFLLSSFLPPPSLSPLFLPVPPVPRGRVHAKAEHKEEIVYADISELSLLVHDSVHGGASDRYAGLYNAL